MAPDRMRWMDQLLNDRVALESLAAELHIVALPGRAPAPRVARLWYRAREAYFELFVDVGPQGITWWQLTLRGLAWTWTRSSGTVRVESTDETALHDRPLSASAVLKGALGVDKRRAVRFASELLASRSEPFIRKCGVLARLSLGDDEAKSHAARI